MKKNSLFMAITSFALIATIMMGTVAPAMAATTQEVQGTTGQQSKDIPVTATVQSVYSVSLPASISLTYGIEEDVAGNQVEGYWYDLRYGAVGKLTSTENVFVRATLPCALNDSVSGKSVSLINAKGLITCEKVWSASEIGSCTYDGVSLTNCNYNYSDSFAIGIKASNIATSGSYTGNLTVDFGLCSN